MLSTNKCGMRTPTHSYRCLRDSFPSSAVHQHCTYMFRTVAVVACSSQPTAEWLKPPYLSPRATIVHLITTQYTNTLEKPG
jgi:hypothetical protein